MPPYDQDDDGPEAPAAVAELRSAVAGADAVLIATPEYNASIPGVLKNALDWVSRPVATNPLRNKPAAVVGASTGAFGAVWAQAELRKVLSTIGARTLPNEVSCRQAAERFDEDGRPRWTRTSAPASPRRSPTSSRPSAPARRRRRPSLSRRRHGRDAAQRPAPEEPEEGLEPTTYRLQGGCSTS